MVILISFLFLFVNILNINYVSWLKEDSFLSGYPPQDQDLKVFSLGKFHQCDPVGPGYDIFGKERVYNLPFNSK